MKMLFIDTISIKIAIDSQRNKSYFVKRNNILLLYKIFEQLKCVEILKISGIFMLLQAHLPGEIHSRNTDEYSNKF